MLVLTLPQSPVSRAKNWDAELMHQLQSLRRKVHFGQGCILAAVPVAPPIAPALVLRRHALARPAELHPVPSIHLAPVVE